MLTRHKNKRGNPSGKPIIAGMRTEPIIENGERLGYKVIDIITGDEGVVAQKILIQDWGSVTDDLSLEKVAIPAIEYAKVKVKSGNRRD